MDARPHPPAWLWWTGIVIAGTGVAGLAGWLISVAGVEEANRLLAALLLLMVIAGLTLLARIRTGRTHPIQTYTTDPKKFIGAQCYPPGSTRPTGARIMILGPKKNKQGKVEPTPILFWDFPCDDLMETKKALDRIYREHCIDKKATVASHVAAGPGSRGTGTNVQLVDPFINTDGQRGISIQHQYNPRRRAKAFFFECDIVPELIKRFEQAVSGCCL